MADEAHPLPLRREVAASTLAPRAPRSRRARGARWVGWLFVLPGLVMYGIFVLVPLLMTVQYSTLRWNGVGPQRWNGLDNYVTVLTDPDLIAIILNAFKLVIFFSFIPVILGLLVASVIRRKLSSVKTHE